jgi:hypothetical protein
MRLIGFSTGALARNDFRKALRMLSQRSVVAVELSALRQDELVPLVEQLDNLDLQEFEYIAFHAPSLMAREFEPIAISVLEQVARRQWPIIVHPNAMHRQVEWARFGDLLCIENMDKRKPVGQTAADLAQMFEVLPRASLCFDIGHARQVDPTMSEAAAILQRFKSRLRQLHVSEVNSKSKHDPLSFESVLAFQRVSHLVPWNTPLILESRVEEVDIDVEIENASKALGAEDVLSLTGD